MSEKIINRENERVVIFNRAPKSRPGWIHIVPKGELPNPEAKIVQVLDDKSQEKIQQISEMPIGTASKAC